jgi:hypothetical protein
MMDVTTDSSLNQSINNAQRHYSSLFFLPSFKKALFGIAVISLIAGASSYFLFPSLGALTNGLLLGLSVFAVNFFFDWVISKVVLGDPIFVLRRTVALSFFGWIFWLFFIILGVVFGVAFNLLWWVKLVS